MPRKSVNRNLKKVLQEKNVSKEESSDMHFTTPANQFQEKPAASGFHKRKRKKLEDAFTNNGSYIDENLEKNLEECARKNNLSTSEMKLLLKKLVANEHVLALVQLKEEDGKLKDPLIIDEDEENQNRKRRNLSVMTRSQRKELKAPALLIDFIDPMQSESEVATLITSELNSDEDDEEYEPCKEEYLSDDDINTTVSDIDSQPTTPKTPFSKLEKLEEKSPSTPRYTKDGLFKVPRERIDSVGSIQEEIIAKRTRSKISLAKTSIEEIEMTLRPPDVTLDMYETNAAHNKEWLEFLNEFTKPLSKTFTLDDDDPEYIAVDSVPVDAEELRDINISKKEIDDLFDDVNVSKKDVVDLFDELFGNLRSEGINLDEMQDRSILQKEVVSKQKQSAIETSTKHFCNQISSRCTDDDCCKTVSVFENPNLGSNITPKTQIEVFQPNVTPTLLMSEQPEEKSSTFSTELIAAPVNVDSSFTRHSSNNQHFANVETCPLTPPIQSQQVSDSSPLRSKGGKYRRAVYENNPQVLPFDDPRNKAFVSVKKQIRREYVDKFKKLQAFQIEEPVVNDDHIGFTDKQIEVVKQQLRVHVQLLAQNFMQTYSHPEYWKLASVQRRMLTEIEEITKKYSHLEVWNLHRALDLIRHWEEELSVDSLENRNLMEFMYHEIEKKSGNIGRFPPRIMKKILESEVFIYPQFLPRIPFRTDKNTVYSEFAPSETYLIAMGLEKHLNEIEKTEIDFSYLRRRSPLKLACERIAYDICMQKTPRRIYDHVKHQLRSKSYNPIKFYFQHKRAPPFKHSIIPINADFCIPPIYKTSELPIMWQEFAKALSAVEIERSCYPNISTPSCGDSLISNKLNEKCISQKKGSRKSCVDESTGSNIIININYVFDGRNLINKFEEYDGSGNIERESTFLDLENCESHHKNIEANPIEFSFYTTGVDNTSSLNRPIICQNLVAGLDKVEGQQSYSKPVSKIKAHNSSYTYTINCGRLIPKNLSKSAKKFRRTRTLKKKIERLSIFYRDNWYRRLNQYKKSSEYIYKAVKYFKVLEIYTTFLKGLKMNCKRLKEETVTGRRGKLLDDENPKSKKAHRLEENCRLMLLPESRNESNKKDAIYAFNFYDKVEETLKKCNKTEDFKRFEKILLSFNPLKEKAADLYNKLEKLFLPDHPELAQVLLTFLLPAEAAEVGKFFEYFMYTNMSTFINKLNIYFNKQPAQIRKIYSSLNELAEDSNVSMESIRAKILPLLKGNQFLIDWFLEIFPYERPTDRLLSEVENVNLKDIDSNPGRSFWQNVSLNDLIEDHDNHSCHLKYINGRIFYGLRGQLPAKLAFLAIDLAKQEECDSAPESEAINCVHGIREYAERRLKAAMAENNCDDVGRSEADDVRDYNYQPEEICDDVTLHTHAIRLNPSLYLHDGDPHNTNSHISHRTKIEDGKCSPKKTTNKDRRKSPKKTVLKLSVGNKRHSSLASSGEELGSNAQAASKKSREFADDSVILGSESSVYCTLKTDYVQKKNDITFDINMSTLQLAEKSANNSKAVQVSQKVTKEEAVWTREEDKIILEEVTVGFENDDILISRILDKIQNRTRGEVISRYQFLQDYIMSKFQCGN